MRERWGHKNSWMMISSTYPPPIRACLCRSNDAKTQLQVKSQGGQVVRPDVSKDLFVACPAGGFKGNLRKADAALLPLVGQGDECAHDCHVVEVAQHRLLLRSI